MKKNKAICTTREAGNMLSAALPTVLVMLENGRLSGFKLNRNWRVYKSSVDAVMRGGSGGNETSEDSRQT